MNCKQSGHRGWLQCVNSSNRTTEIRIKYIGLHFQMIKFCISLSCRLPRNKRMKESSKRIWKIASCHKFLISLLEHDVRNIFLIKLLVIVESLASYVFILLVNTIRIAKPEKAAMVENLLVNMARRGQIGGQLGENELKGLLEQVSEQTKQETTVKFDRRRAALDDDWLKIWIGSLDLLVLYILSFLIICWKVWNTQS